VNQRLLSAPAAMYMAWLFAVRTGNSVINPVRVITPILLALSSGNQRLPSGPVVMPRGPEPAVGVAYSVMQTEAIADCAPAEVLPPNPTSG
jgi:hypothetical protein